MKGLEITPPTPKDQECVVQECEKKRHGLWKLCQEHLEDELAIRRLK